MNGYNKQPYSYAEDVALLHLALSVKNLEISVKLSSLSWELYLFFM